MIIRRQILNALKNILDEIQYNNSSLNIFLNYASSVQNVDLPAVFLDVTDESQFKELTIGFNVPCERICNIQITIAHKTSEANSSKIDDISELIENKINENLQKNTLNNLVKYIKFVNVNMYKDEEQEKDIYIAQYNFEAKYLYKKSNISTTIN